MGLTLFTGWGLQGETSRDLLKEPLKEEFPLTPRYRLSSKKQRPCVEKGRLWSGSA